MTQEPAATPEPPDGPAGRVASIDVVRGLVMVVMVLDHVRDFLTDVRVDPTDLSVTTPALFFTRWATHFCAPTFVFLAGVSAALSGTRRTTGELSRHLLVRGLWLLVLSQAWENVFLFFTYPHVVLALVLWAIGWSLIALAGLVSLPRWVVGGLGLALIVGHNAFDGVRFAGEGAELVRGILHEPGLRRLLGGIPILIGYPLIPWVGVMALGYAVGPVFRMPAGRRRRILIAAGVGSIAAFLALRGWNGYGDPRPWSVQDRLGFTVLSFLNCQKYPPSLLYLLMTLGPMFLALALLDRPLGRWARPLRMFGGVPLFFYLMQWPLAHGIAVALEWVRGHDVGWMFRFPPFQSPPGYGHRLTTVYVVWIVTVGLLYYPCWLYARWWAGRSTARKPAVPGEWSSAPDGDHA